MNTPSDWRRHSERLIACGYLMLGAARIEVTDRGKTDVKILAATLLARTLSNMRGVVALERDGLIVEALILVRTCFENQFWLAGLAKEGRVFADKMPHDEIRARQSRGQFLFDDAKERESLPPDTEDNLRMWLKESKKEWPAAAMLNPQKVAQGTEVSGAYVFYQHLSAIAAHPSLTALNRYIVVSRKGDETTAGLDLDPPPTESEVGEALGLGCSALLGACVAINQILDATETTEILAECWEEFQTLAARKSAKYSADGKVAPAMSNEAALPDIPETDGELYDGAPV
jgi:hypothetical protein